MAHPTHNTPSKHSLNNPHEPGSDEWKKWEHHDMQRCSDPAARTVARITADQRLMALRRSFDTPETVAMLAADEAVEEAAGPPPADPWSVGWAAEMRRCLYPMMLGIAFDPDDDD